MYALLTTLAIAATQGVPSYAPRIAAPDLAPVAAAQADVERARATLRATAYAAAEARTVDVPARMLQVAELQARLARLDIVRTPRAEGPLRAPVLGAPIAGDPGDSLYRAGTSALNRGDYARAAQLFRQVREKYPRSVRAGDSFYWEAFALYRQGGSDNLRTARTLLAQQKSKFPGAATGGDASSLYGRVQGELARRGDPDAQIWVNTQTRDLAAPAVAPTASASAAAGAARAAAPVAAEARALARAAAVPALARSDWENDDDALPQGCDRDAYEAKIEALNALISMENDRAVPIIRHVLAKRDACSAGLRKKAVFLLAQHQDDSTGAVLLDVVRNDPDQDVKAQAVFWLSQVNSPQAIAALEDILKTSTDVDLQRKALFALSQQHDPRGAQILRAYAERSDVPAELQEQAIFWLSQGDDGKNGEFLRGLYGRLTRESAREKVLFALSQEDDPANGKWLVDRARDTTESIELRKRALFWAGQRKGALPDLLTLYGSTTDREMREQLVFVYSQSRDRAAADKLIDIAKNDPDPELRKKALFWLGQSNDPRVAQLLQDIIDK